MCQTHHREQHPVWETRLQTPVKAGWSPSPWHLRFWSYVLQLLCNYANSMSPNPTESAPVWEEEMCTQTGRTQAYGQAQEPTRTVILSLDLHPPASQGNTCPSLELPACAPLAPADASTQHVVNLLLEPPNCQTGAAGFAHCSLQAHGEGTRKTVKSSTDSTRTTDLTHSELHVRGPAHHGCP